MRQYFGIAALVAGAGMSCSALAQDSVSNQAGNLPGDALNPWTQGCAAYVVDLAPITTSQGHVFGVAPVLKTSKMSSANFNALGSSVSISPDTVANVPFSRASYSFWNTPGAGVNGEFNNAGQMVSPSGSAYRFAVAMSEFGTTDAGRSYNGITAALINYTLSQPNRLFVDRRMAAINMPNATSGDSSQLGGSSIDANGNLYYRGDNFGSTGANQLTGNNIFRTRLADRNCSVINLISSAATLDATDRLVVGSTTVHSVPAHIPASVVGGNGLYAGPNFNAQYVYGPALGSITSTLSHLDPVATSLSQRGSFGQTKATPLGGVFTLGVLGQDAADDSTVINVFGVNADGSVASVKGFQVPTSITDNDDGFTVNYLPGAQDAHHYGSTAFRGGVGHVALGRDAGGNNLIAMTMSENGFSGDFANQIVVGRYTDPNGAIEWTMAAYVDQLMPGTMDAGKAIYDQNGVEIGQLVDLIAVTGGSPFGPSMSAPAMDSAGNIWFIGAVELYDRLLDGSSDFDGALIRAIYDQATFSYRLELVLEVGSVISGQNSGLDYRIDFLGTAANNSAPSPSSVWSSAVSDQAWGNADPATLSPSDPRTNGGAVIQTGITYDVNGDGFFNNPTSVNFDPGLPADETYQVALYVGYYQEGPPPCPADLAAPFGVLNIFDIQAFIGLYNTQNPAADLAAPFGVFNIFDIQAYIGLYNQGCP
ncbi:MAG: hypothetical protein D6692_14375 [Planctomycetota bacterium]|nr:MAG: hypothetical protein D6692_14375 [Planctomycetota bacterium]